ncbi:MAG TPA: helix-turn-helix transcriptional regulator [Dehalococcoidia bacterium]|nr:helix-turn-helix transcriptional regulator [Dehalococcoidia bacterium]
MDMIIRTRVFELCDGRYRNLSELAHAMGLSVSQVYRVREGKRSINQKFIIGAKKAFPDYGLDDLFYLDNDRLSDFAVGTSGTRNYRSIN